MTIVVFGAITDIWNVSIYIHIMVTTAPHLWNKSQKMECWAAHYQDTRKHPWLPSPTQTMSRLFLSLPTYLLNILVSTIQTLSQITSQDCTGHIQKHLITTGPLTYVTNGIQDFVKCYIKSWVHLDLRPDNMLFGGLQPTICKTYFNRIKYLMPCGYLRRSLDLNVMKIEISMW